MRLRELLGLRSRRLVPKLQQFLSWTRRSGQALAPDASLTYRRHDIRPARTISGKAWTHRIEWPLSPKRTSDDFRWRAMPSCAVIDQHSGLMTLLARGFETIW